MARSENFVELILVAVYNHKIVFVGAVSLPLVCCGVRGGGQLCPTPWLRPAATDNCDLSGYAASSTASILQHHLSSSSSFY